MRRAGWLNEWLRLPSRLALMLGLGALSVAAARADTPDDAPGGALGSVLIRTDGDRIFLSEGGRDFRELQLSDTAEARHLRQLLKSRGTAGGKCGIRLDSTILAGGGGSGFHWWGWTEKAGHSGKAGAEKQPASPKDQRAPDKPDTAAAKKG